MGHIGDARARFEVLPISGDSGAVSREPALRSAGEVVPSRSDDDRACRDDLRAWEDMYDWDDAGPTVDDVPPPDRRSRR